ncbi:MAG: ATP-grasp domain-containing protein [Pseudomonadota bacterium]|nr:ATP-grasp domain-containing protein [Pseudomonadota bacterium]
MTGLRLTVTGAGSLFGQGILKSLRQADIPVVIQGLDYFPDAFGFRYCDSRGLLPDFLSPSVTEDAWFDALAGFVTQHGSELLFAGADFEVLPLAEQRDAFQSRTGCRLIVPNAGLVRVCKDKLLTAERLAEAGLDAPLSAPSEIGFDEAATRVGSPFIVKPRGGARSRGVALVETERQFDAAVAGSSDMMVQQFLPDSSREYSCGVLILGDKVDAVTPLRRQLRDGNTWTAIAAERHDPEAGSVEDYCRRIADALGADAPINIQCRIVDGAPMAFEINPRFSGTTYFRTLLGVNEPRRVLQHHLGQPLSEPPVLRPGRVRRYFEECVEEA